MTTPCQEPRHRRKGIETALLLPLQPKIPLPSGTPSQQKGD